MKRPISILFVLDLLVYLSLPIVAYAVALAEMLVKFLDIKKSVELSFL